MWKLEKWWSLSKFLTITITSFNFFNCPVKLWRNLKMKFRSEFNLGFTNHGYLHNGAWKAWNNVKIKRAQKTRHKMFKIASSFRSSKCLKTTVELTITIKKAKPCSPWNACSVFDWKYLSGINLVQSFKIITLRWNFVLWLIQICKIPWWWWMVNACSVFDWKYLFGQIWSKKSKLLVSAEILH